MSRSFAALDCQKRHLNCFRNYVPLLPAHVRGVTEGPLLAPSRLRGQYATAEGRQDVTQRGRSICYQLPANSFYPC